MNNGRIFAKNKKINFGSYCGPMLLSLRGMESHWFLTSWYNNLNACEWTFTNPTFKLTQTIAFPTEPTDTCAASHQVLNNQTLRNQVKCRFVNQINISPGIHDPAFPPWQKGILPWSSVEDGRLQSHQAILKSEEINYKNHSTHLQMVYSCTDPYIDTCCT